MENKDKNQLIDYADKKMYSYLRQILSMARHTRFFSQADLTENRQPHNEDGWVIAYLNKLYFAHEFPEASALTSRDIDQIAKTNAHNIFAEIYEKDQNTKVNIDVLKGNEKKRIIRDQAYFFHDEPWLTLMALWGIYITCRSGKHNSISDLFTKNLMSKTQTIPLETPFLNQGTECRIEVTLKANPIYDKSIEAKYNNGYKHLYADVMADAGKKQNSKNSQIYEGSTHLDGLINWYSSSKRYRIYIEAKYLSDISYQTRFIADRNQIARTIDAALYNAMYAGKDSFDVSQIEDFWFFLLTPINYRTDKYGSVPSRYLNSENTCEARSRLYCYKMDEYLSGQNLKRDLPHWDKYLIDQDWDKIASHIGWISWEEILETVVKERTFSKTFMENYLQFFYDRGIIPKFEDPKDTVHYRFKTNPDLKAKTAELKRLLDKDKHGNK